MPALLLPFLGVVAVLTITPGPDMALVVRNGVRDGTRAAWLTGLGCCTGITVHATATILGLSALLAASAAAYTVVKIAGACYLVYLGGTSLWRLVRERSGRGGAQRVTPVAAADAEQPPPATAAGVYRQGLLCNLLNPKIALLFLTLLPQFVAPGEPRIATSALLAAAFLVIAVLWWRVFSWLVAGLGSILAAPRVRRALDGLTGVVLIGLGVRVAIAHG